MLTSRAGEITALPDFIIWPKEVLRLGGSSFIKESFSRSGGTSLENSETTTRTDLGKWRAEIGPIPLYYPNEYRVWNAIETYLGGRPGLVAVPCNEKFTAPYVGGQRSEPDHTTHSDGTTFSDGTQYRTRSIDLRMATTAQLGATVVSIEAVNAGDDLTGIYFSYQFALYQTGELISKNGDIWQLRIFPAIRQIIPAGADLECDDPACLMHLETDTAMSVEETPGQLATPSVRFVEAVDYWNILATS